jgi:DNA-binding transcriptional ArsR family regulator/DNA-binding Xre family transcriptional regulator
MTRRKLRIRAIAESKGFTMAHLGRAAQLDKNTTQRVWRNEFRVARQETLERIARALDVPVADLFVDNEEQRQAPAQAVKRRKTRWTAENDHQGPFARSITWQEATQLADAIDALADSKRIRIISQLSQHEDLASTEELSFAYRMSHPTFSFHLSVLTKAGFVSKHYYEQWTYYTLNRDSIRGIDDKLKKLFERKPPSVKTPEE